MMKLEELKIAILQLPQKDLVDFRAWFEEFEAQLWDRKIEEDIKAGKLDELAQQAIEAFEAGQATEL